jgi:hypothetical protein
MNQPGSAILVDFEITGRPEPQSDEALWRNSPPNQHAKWVYNSCTDEFYEYIYQDQSRPYMRLSQDNLRDHTQPIKQMIEYG